MNRAVKLSLKLVFIAALLYFVGLKLAGNWQAMIEYKWAFNPGWFVVAVVLHLVTLAAFSQVWCSLVSGFGYQVPFRYGFKISYITNLGRYIPGKIWPVFGMIHYARRAGITQEAAVTSWGLVQLFALPSAFLVGLVGLLFYPRLLSEAVDSSQQLTMLVLVLIALAASAFLILAPDRSMLLANKLLKKLGRPLMTFRLSTGAAAKIYLSYMICWLLYGAAFYCFLHSILADPKIKLFEAATAFILAYQIGYVALFAPGGIGIRELLLTGALAPYVGPIAGGVAVAARFWNLIVEISAAVVAFLIKMETKETEDGKREKESSRT